MRTYAAALRRSDQTHATPPSASQPVMTVLLYYVYRAMHSGGLKMAGRAKRAPSPDDDEARSAALQGRDIDLRAAKALVARVYPRGDAFREALLQEPDFLTREEASTKLAIYLRILLAPASQK